MTRPELARFADRLDAVRAEAVRRGELSVPDYEALLVDPDFDD